MLRFALACFVTMSFQQSFAQQSKAMTALDMLMQMSADMRMNPRDVSGIEKVSDTMNYANKCDEFASDGNVQVWGTVVEQELDRQKYTMVDTGSSDIALYCPNYKSMDENERKSVWMLVLVSMAHYESSCNNKEKAKGPNGTAAGLLQLHRGHEANYSNGCRNSDSNTPERSLICGLSMINDQIQRGEPLFSEHSYWEVLRPRGRSQKARKIESAIRQFPPCQVSAK